MSLFVVRAPAEADLNALARDWPPGLYTTFRTLDGGRKVVGLSRHLERLYGPAAELGIEPRLEATALRRRLAQTLAEGLDEGGEARLRLHLGGDGRFYLAWQPFTPPPVWVYRRGVTAITLNVPRPQPHYKRSDFARRRAPVLAQVRAVGAYEGLIRRRGRIWEGLTSNFFYVQGGALGTAARGVLPGVTRAAVLRLARECGLPRRYRALPLRELPALEEAFLCSSSRGLVPIVAIDGQPVGEGRPGPLTRWLAIAYRRQQARLAEPLAPSPAC